MDTTLVLDEVRRRLTAIGDQVVIGGHGLGEHASGGKLTRGRLILLAAALGDAGAATASRYATAVELIYAGALCHDDLVDSSLTRRSKPTALRTGGAPAAVFGGLFLMARGGELLAHESLALRGVVARALREVARGQADEVCDSFEPISPEAYLRRAHGKTGALYELAGLLGAFAGGLPVTVANSVARFAADLGLAFQLNDDVRDFLAGADLGREVGTSLRQGILTYPLLLTLAGRAGGSKRLRRLLAEPHRLGALAEITLLLCGNGAFRTTTQLAIRHVERALDALSTIRPSPAVDELVAFARGFVMEAGSEPRTDPQVLNVCEASRACGRAAARPVVTQILPAMLGGLPNRIGLALESLWAHLPDALRREDSWVHHAAMATAVSVSVLELGGVAVVAHAQDREFEFVRVVAALDLYVAELFALLAVLPGAVGARLWQSLAGLLGDAASGATEAPEHCVCPSYDDIIRLGDTIGSVTAELVTASPPRPTGVVGAS